MPEKVKVISEFALPKTVKELKRFLAMINFYKRFIPHAGNKKNDKIVIQWDEETKAAFERCKGDLANASFLAHPASDVELSLSVDASDMAVGAVLHQIIDEIYQPLGFFSKKLNSAGCKYSTYDRELLAMYQGVKHFKHLLEGRVFHINTDHKPLIFAFRQKNDNSTPRQIRHLDLVGQFTTDIRHISGVDNVVADFLSRICSITGQIFIDYEVQRTDPELKNLMENQASCSLQLKYVTLSDTVAEVCCDISNDVVRPFIPKEFRDEVIIKFHEISHPGVRGSNKLVSKRFVWPGMNKDVANVVRRCIACQRAKVNRHNKAPISTYVLPNNRFEHLNLDIVGPLPVSRGYRYVLTCIDRYSRWPEAMPLVDITAESVASALMFGWISRFGVPRRITTDQGRQFESRLFNELSKMCAVKNLRTTAYHPQANGLIERWHRSLKAAIMCYKTKDWCAVLPLILLGLRSTFKEDLKSTPAEMLYGTTISLPGQFFTEYIPKSEQSEFVKSLKEQMASIRPTLTSNHSSEKVFIQKELRYCSHVFLRNDTVRAALTPPFDGPYPVISRDDKKFELDINGKKVVVTIDRVKVAHTTDDPFDKDDVPVAGKQPETLTDGEIPKPKETKASEKPKTTIADLPKKTKKRVTFAKQTFTRSGRRVKCPDRYVMM